MEVTYNSLVAKIIEEKVFTDDPNLLKLADKKGRTIAHIQVEYGWKTNNVDILKLADIKGVTVAHKLVECSWLISQEKEQEHYNSKNNSKIKSKNNINFWTTENKEILKLANIFGWTVAHEQALHGWTTNDEEILKLRDMEGLTVAHIQAHKKWTTENKEILKLSDRNGKTIAHIQAEKGWITKDSEILSLRDKRNISVFDVINKKFPKFFENVTENAKAKIIL